MTELAVIASCAVLATVLIRSGGVGTVEYEMDWWWTASGTVHVTYHREQQTFRFIVHPGRDNRLALNSMLIRYVNDPDMPLRVADANRILGVVNQVQGVMP